MLRVATLLFAIGLLSAEAGITKVDFEYRQEYCPEASVKWRYFFGKTLDSTTVVEEVTVSERNDLVQAADFPTCSTLATTATSVLGTWYTSLSSADQTNFCEFVQDMADSD